MLKKIINFFYGLFVQENCSSSRCSNPHIKSVDLNESPSNTPSSVCSTDSSSTLPVKFSDLQPGDKAKIIGYGSCDKIYRQRLLSMGLTLGSVFSVKRKAPLGDPFQIEIRGSSLSLRKREANQLNIQRVA